LKIAYILPLCAISADTLSRKQRIEKKVQSESTLRPEGVI